MPKRILITSALPYANGPIHLGHMVEYIQSDIYTRFLKTFTSIKTIHCCADDTHGTPIELNAEKLGISPEELIEKYHKEHQQDFKDFFVNFDSYYSTNSSENKKYADQIFLALKKKGLIYTKEVENFYDPEKKRFLPDRYVKGQCPKCEAGDQYGDVCEKCNAAYKPIDLINPYSTLSGIKPVRKKSIHYFFRLSKLSGKLERWLKGNKKLQPEIVNYVKNWIRQGLNDWDISRDGPYFGFKIPGEEDKYYYVWLDAPIGYISSTANYCKNNNEKVDDYWKSKDTNIIHFIGKDITYFHLLFWPAMLMESGFSLPSRIHVHGFLTVNKEKMSKSRGTFITARQYLKKYDPEFLRYYYAANLTSKVEDVDLDLKDFKSKINHELVANIANLCYRVLSFCYKNFDGKVAKYKDKKIIKESKNSAQRIIKYYHDLEFREAVKEILKLSSIGNKHFQNSKPWKVITYDKNKAHASTSECVEIVKDLIVVLSPILPRFSEKIVRSLGIKVNSESIGKSMELKVIKKPEIIFSKVEEVKFADVYNLNLRVGKVLEVIPLADKLYLLKVDTGEKRQIVAGIRPFYKEEELKGKHLIIVTNIKKAKFKGEESNGMLLASENKGKVKVLESNASPGTQVLPEGFDAASDKEVKAEDVVRAKIIVKNRKAYADGKQLKANNKDVTSEADGNVR